MLVGARISTWGQPLEYTELQYVSVDATKSQYVDTGIICSASTRLEVKFKIDSSAPSTSNFCVVGARVDYQGPAFTIWGCTNSGSNHKFARFDMYPKGSPGASGKSTIFGTTETRNSVCITRKEGVANWDNGVRITDNGFSDVEPALNLYFMGCNQKNKVLCPMSGDVYYLKMFNESGVMTMHLVPVIKKSDKGIYFYDKVTEEYFGNAGTQNPLDVTAGPKGI